jgi:hypothetical protein
VRAGGRMIEKPIGIDRAWDVEDLRFARQCFCLLDYRLLRPTTGNHSSPRSPSGLEAMGAG